MANFDFPFDYPEYKAPATQKLTFKEPTPEEYNAAMEEMYHILKEGKFNEQRFGKA